MLKLGGTATPSHLTAFQAIEEHFGKLGVDIEWVLYSDDMAVVNAFVEGEIDLAWNGPLNYVRIKNSIETPCQVVAMRDVDFNVVTHFFVSASSDIHSIEDLTERTFAFGSRGSVETGLLAYYFLKQSEIDPDNDLRTMTFSDERPPTAVSGELEVLEQVLSGSYDAGAISGPTLNRLISDETIKADDIRIIWTSEGYSHCCFTAQPDINLTLLEKLQDGFEEISAADPTGKVILQEEACSSIVRGTPQGWEIIEQAARDQRLI
ncbi:MAG: phosphate/phosphite/phosphonate ABC transporter substrate-binding protein [Chloroflexota bacterium]|nr:phosphate/phosphite/phosphonate ABC transporter substrate-binding protein [Chloroflexota bacterium]